MSKIFNQKPLTSKRQSLRNNLTTFEAILWKSLQNNQLNNHKFRRQYSVKNYIVDFYCPKEKLVIEVDGDSHFISEEAIKYDLQRTKFFNSLGIRVLRFTNVEVLNNLEGVLQTIASNFKENIH